MFWWQVCGILKWSSRKLDKTCSNALRTPKMLPRSPNLVHRRGGSRFNAYYACCAFTFFIPECGAKGSRFLWGLRVELCVLDAALRSQPFMVSNRSGHSWRLAMSFRVASIALHDILTCFIMCWKSFGVTGAIFLRGFQKMTCIFRGAQHFGHVHFHFPCQVQHFLRVVLRVFFQITLSAWSGDDVHIACGTSWEWYFVWRGHRLVKIRRVWNVAVFGTLYTFHFSLNILHPTLHTLHFTLHTLHLTLYTLHSTLYTLHSTLYSAHFSLNILHPTLHTLHFTLHTLHLTLYTLNSALCTLHFILFTLHYTAHFALTTLHSTLYASHFTLHTLYLRLHIYMSHCILYTLHFSLHTPHSTPYTLHCTLYNSHFTLHTLHFTLHTLHCTSTLSTWHSTLFTLHVTLHTTHCIPQSTLHTLHCLHIPHFALHPIPQSTLVR